VPRRWIVEIPEEIADLARDDIQCLRAGRVIPMHGYIRCITFGHLIRLVIWRLRQSWDREKPVEERLSTIASHLGKIGGFSAVEGHLGGDLLHAPKLQHAVAQENEAMYGASDGEVSF